MIETARLLFLVHTAGRLKYHCKLLNVLFCRPIYISVGTTTNQHRQHCNWLGTSQLHSSRVITSWVYRTDGFYNVLRGHSCVACVNSRIDTLTLNSNWLPTNWLPVLSMPEVILIIHAHTAIESNCCLLDCMPHIYSHFHQSSDHEDPNQTGKKFEHFTMWFHSKCNFHP